MAKKIFNSNDDAIFNEESAENYRIDKEALYSNSAPRCPVVILVDISESMSNSSLYGGKIKPIDEVNKGLRQLFDYIETDYTTAKRAEVAVLTFGTETTIVSDFGPIEGKENFPTLSVNGRTNMVPAITMAYDMIKKRKAEYKEHGRSYYRPLVILLTDGGPSECSSSYGNQNTKQQYQSLKEKINQATRNKELQFFAVKIGKEENHELHLKHAELINGFDYQIPVGGLDPEDFPKFFTWLSASVTARSSGGNFDNASVVDPSEWWKKLV